MATTINGVSRYAVTGSSITTTTFNGVDSQFGNLITVNVPFAGADLTTSVIAPCTGKVVAVKATSQTTTDGTNKIAFVVQNESNSSADIVASVLYDDDPVLTTNVAADLTVVAANAAVDVGDNIEVGVDITATIAGGSVTLYFEPSDD